MAFEPLRSPIFDKVLHLEHGFYTANVEPPAPLGRAHQVHGADIKEYIGEESLNPHVLPKADAVMTVVKDLWVGVQTADCIPALMAPIAGPAVIAVHGGWRGVLEGIFPRALEAMEKKGIRPRDMLAALGPAIGPCCFEVGPELLEAFEKKWGWMWTSSPHLVPYKERHLDLKAIARMQLVHSGMLEPNIDVIQLCTYCGILRLHGEEFRAETNDWASHRRATHNGLKAARQWSVIRMMSPETEKAKKAAATGNLI